MSKEEIIFIEELSLNAHPALNTMSYDGWLMKYSEGYTNRANSVNMLYESKLPFEEKIPYCEEMYTKQNLPTVFKITPLSEQMDFYLENRGYEYVTKTNIMRMELCDLNKEDLHAEVVEGISEDFIEGYFSLIQIDEHSKEVARKIFSNTINNRFSAIIKEDGKIVAVGICVAEHDYVGLYNIVVSRDYRRKGYGRDICASLLAKAESIGTKSAYLQVVNTNEKAKGLYHKLGFHYEYSYWYRVKPLFSEVK